MIDSINARIQSASIKTEDHGLLTAWLELDYGGSCQGFGGYNFGPVAEKQVETGAKYFAHFVKRILQISDAPDWQSVPGKIVRVHREHGYVVAIGHALKEDWFYPALAFKEKQ